METEEQVGIWNSKEEEDSMVSVTVGRVMSTLLTARSTKLLDAISGLNSSPNPPNPPNPLAVSLENSLRILHKYVKDGAEKVEALDEVLIPMIEHSLRGRESKHKKQEMIILNWLFHDELLFQALARNFADILLRKEDHRIALGWCVLARHLIEYDNTMIQLPVSGLKERHGGFLEVLCRCNTRLLSMINNGCTLQDGFELPTRLSVAAADCVIALSVALTKNDNSENKKKSFRSSRQDLQRLSVAADSNQKKVQPISPASEGVRDMDMSLLLWTILDQLIMLLQRLLAWSRKSRSLHAKGLERVLKWLQETKNQYKSSQDQAGLCMVKTGILLLSSCWKHYGILLHLENQQISSRYKELLDQYLSGIEVYAENYTEENIDDKETGAATINFFLNCLLLLLGRFTAKHFDSFLKDYKLHISRVVTAQLSSGDEDVIDGAVSILKAVIFGTNHPVSGGGLMDSKQMNSVIPILLNLLDERDGTARAVVTLIAEYCSTSSDGHVLGEVLKRVASGNVSQRRNALDVLSEVIHILSDSAFALPHSLWEDIANHLLGCVKDEEKFIRAIAAQIIPLIDPSLVLPELVRLLYSPDETIQQSAGSTLFAVLKYHNQKPDVVCMLLDCLSNLNGSSDLQKTAAGNRAGLKLDADRVLKFIPEWSKSVTSWNLMIGPLIDKMFAEPSNAIVVKFLSYISDYLAGSADIVFERLLSHSHSQKEIDESFLSEPDMSYTGDVKQQHSLFDRLCPLLIIRLLPLRVFDDLKCFVVYGDLPNRISKHDNMFDIGDTECVAGLLLKRAFNNLEFEDVRKLAAELCGRVHPNVLLPVVSSQLERATNDHDILKIKASLFSICTSLVIRGLDSLTHPFMPRIREAIETVLLWPSKDGDEISKAQHGCIDCMAIMVCTELQAPEMSKKSTSKKTSISGNTDSSGNAAMTVAFHSYVMDQLTCDENKQISFRLCMANVLISACQKISDAGRKPFALRTLRQLTRSIHTLKEPEIRAACIQVLFSIVYNLKSLILPYSSDLLKLSLESLEGVTEKERIAGAKLLTSLMASEEAVTRNISEGLLEARSLLSRVSQTDSSAVVRQMCTKLLLCLTSI